MKDPVCGMVVNPTSVGGPAQCAQPPPSAGQHRYPKRPRITARMIIRKIHPMMQTPTALPVPL